MDNERELMERLEGIEAKEDRRLLLAKIQLALVAILVVGLGILACVVLPKAKELYEEADAAIAQMQRIMSETEGVIAEIDWDKFKEIDFSKFNDIDLDKFNEIDFSKLNDLDIDELNTAIKNLNDAVEAVQKKAAEMEKAFDSMGKWFGQIFGT